MIRLLPFILIPILVLGGLWYWRNLSARQNLAASQTSEKEKRVQTQDLVEVPKTLPAATTEDRVKSLEEVITKLVSQVNAIKSANSQTNSSNSLDSRLTGVESAVTELTARVSALEKATPAPAAAASSSKSPLYIPMGAGGGPWADQDWNTLTEYQASINPDNYSGYSNMSLEANFRLTEAAGTASVRLYNVTDGSSVASQIDTASTSFGLKTSGTFRLPSSQKTYTIQVKSSQGKDLYVQSARVKVNF